MLIIIRASYFWMRLLAFLGIGEEVSDNLIECCACCKGRKLPWNKCYNGMPAELCPKWEAFMGCHDTK
jgi:hypothetical protein